MNRHPRSPTYCAALGLAVMFGAACGSDLTGPSPVYNPRAVVRGGRVEISGRVIDYTTNTGVPNATIGFLKIAEYGQLPPSDRTIVADSTGLYRLSIASGEYYAYVDGVLEAVFVLSGPAFRGDILVHPMGCAAFYGEVVDAKTRQPLSGVAVSLVGSQTLTDITGWYRLDIGCFTSYGIGTTFIYFNRPGYAERSVIAGRRESLAGRLRRIDAALSHG